MHNRSLSHYEVLRVSGFATQRQIRRSYLKLAKVYHPDKNSNINPEEWLAILEAYEVLSCPISRAKYNQLCNLDSQSGVCSDKSEKKLQRSRPQLSSLATPFHFGHEDTTTSANATKVGRSTKPRKPLSSDFVVINDNLGVEILSYILSGFKL